MRPSNGTCVTCAAVVVALAALILPATAGAAPCSREVWADVVAFDQVFFWNRLGAVEPQGMIFALRRDVVPIDSTLGLVSGNVRLREGKRPRPLVLRMNVGDCLRVEFQNLLARPRVDEDQPATREASFHPIGLELVGSIASDGSFVGRNASSLADVGERRTYRFYAEREGQHVLYSAGTTTGGQGDGGQINAGLFGAVIVEPAGSRWYRSQATRAELDRVTVGITASGHPKIAYGKRYPTTHPRGDIPVLEILDRRNDEIVHGEITAIVAGSDPDLGGDRAGWFAEGAFPPNVFTHPERFQVFREFVIVYHDEIGAVQAFQIFEDEQGGFEHTLHSGRDAFAINYGTGGIGAEILANRFGVGPMHDCAACKYEEFFLTSWAVGDPAMVVDVPANVPCMVDTNDPNDIEAEDPEFAAKVAALRHPELHAECDPTPGPKATKAFFPDDPANVYHGYLRDHTRFRVLHAGSKEHHIHHLHAHQWLYTADSDKSTYLDSQALGPGSSFTMEIAYEGGGNKNLTQGDSIFHCHFYPHFAQGMWALWRVHDVFEWGTPLDENGRPKLESRALPDGEIARGTPIPAVVPLPGKPMAPLPAEVAIVGGQVVLPDAAVLRARKEAGEGRWNPGYPFYIPGKAGERPPHPPLDTIDDGGLPRHLIDDTTAIDEAHTRLDFHKELLNAKPRWIPEKGTPHEKLAMDFHAIREHRSCEPSGFCLGEPFVANGLPPVPGAPYSDPCIDIEGNPAGNYLDPLTYKAADIEDRVIFNKVGWHFDQQRFTALWDDVLDYLEGDKPPEPLFFRANSIEHCIEFQLTNLVPKEYQQDDFQVRTPTDVLGQHIHLVKFDVTSSDGAANGYNYEDGSFSPEEVDERIRAIRAWNGCEPGEFSLPDDPTPKCPRLEQHPFFTRPEWLGATTTVQRWYADPVYDNQRNDRTLRTVFTHDHFSPSTHQQAGLYAGLVVEKQGSVWRHNETGDPLGGRFDGGPTTWQAVIEGEETFREFLLEFADFQLAYEGDRPINPPARKNIGLPDLVAPDPECTDGGPGRPCPELISADDVGTMSLNYRNEPIALRVLDPSDKSQAAGLPGDLAFAFQSRIDRKIPALNSQPSFYRPLTFDLRPGDPFTPLLRAYENDRVQIRILVGAHEEGHNFSINGIKWLFEPSEIDSGFRNSQMMGISEHFEFIVPHVIKNPAGEYVDRLYAAGSSTDDLWNGIWGLFRTYTGVRQDLEPLPTNPHGKAYLEPGVVAQFGFSCPQGAPPRRFDVSAVAAKDALPEGRLYYNRRTDGSFGRLFDPTAILYVKNDDLDFSTQPPKLRAGIDPEPLILRARAGECIQLYLTNHLTNGLLELDGWNALPMLVEGFNANDVRPSAHVGLHPQLVYFDVSRFDGQNVGGNKVQTVRPVLPPKTQLYEWYAGHITVNDDGSADAIPIEFGATNLISADRIEHASKGAIGALIIEPEGANWTVSPKLRAQAFVENPAPLPGQDAKFREFVTVTQTDVNLRTGDGTVHGRAIRNLADNVEDAEDSGAKAVNYKTEPLWKRMQHPPELDFSETDDFTDWFDVVSNSKVGGQDPQTPVFTAGPGEQIRFRLLSPGGHSRNQVFALHGHVWDQEPYLHEPGIFLPPDVGSTDIGRNDFSFWEGARMGHGPTNHFDAVIRHGAGGIDSIPGDYLWRDQTSTHFDGGIWGLLRVLEPPPTGGGLCADTFCRTDQYCCNETCCVNFGTSCTQQTCAMEQ